MTHISRRKITSIDYSHARKQLVDVIAHLKIDGAAHLINGLLTEAEQVMLIKRFATILMFQQDYSTYRVSQAIGISTSTARLIYEDYIAGRYDGLLSSIPKKQKSDFIKLVEDFMLSRVSMKARSRLTKRALG